MTPIRMGDGMARSTNSTKKAAAGTEAAANPAGGGDAIEQQVVAFAEQLGRIVGTVQAKAEGWMDRAALTDELSRIRDSASSLLTQLGESAQAATGQIVSRVRGAGPQAAPAATSTS